MSPITTPPRAFWHTRPHKHMSTRARAQVAPKISRGKMKGQKEKKGEGAHPGGRADAGPLSGRARVDPHHQHTLWDLAAPRRDSLRNLRHDAVFGDLDAERGALNLRQSQRDVIVVSWSPAHTSSS